MRLVSCRRSWKRENMKSENVLFQLFVRFNAVQVAHPAIQNLRRVLERWRSVDPLAPRALPGEGEAAKKYEQEYNNNLRFAIKYCLNYNMFLYHS